MVDEQNELMRDLLFSSTNMAAMTQRENHLSEATQEMFSSNKHQTGPHELEDLKSFTV